MCFISSSWLLSFLLQAVLHFCLFVYAFFTPLFGYFLYIIHCFLLFSFSTFYLSLTYSSMFFLPVLWILVLIHTYKQSVVIHTPCQSQCYFLGYFASSLSSLNCSISGPLLVLLKEHWLLGSTFHTWVFCPLLSRFIPLNSGCLMEVPNFCAWSSLPPSVVSRKRRASSKSALDQEGPNWSQKYPWLSADCQGSFEWPYSWAGCLRSVIVTSVQSLQPLHFQFWSPSDTMDFQGFPYFSLKSSMHPCIALWKQFKRIEFECLKKPKHIFSVVSLWKKKILSTSSPCKIGFSSAPILLSD